MCDLCCGICFTTTAVTLQDSDIVILSGGQHKVSGLRHVDMAWPPPAVANNVYKLQWVCSLVSIYLSKLWVTPSSWVSICVFFAWQLVQVQKTSFHIPSSWYST
jgi:hypothetical protein